MRSAGLWSAVGRRALTPALDRVDLLRQPNDLHIDLALHSIPFSATYGIKRSPQRTQSTTECPAVACGLGARVGRRGRPDGGAPEMGEQGNEGTGGREGGGDTREATLAASCLCRAVRSHAHSTDARANAHTCLRESKHAHHTRTNEQTQDFLRTKLETGGHVWAGQPEIPA